MDMRSEPAALVGTITAFVTAAIGLLVAFGLDISDDQRTAILSMTAVLAPVIAGFVIRSKVYAPDTVRTIMAGQRPKAPAVPREQWGVNKIGTQTDGDTAA